MSHIAIKLILYTKTLMKKKTNYNPILKPLKLHLKTLAVAIICLYSSTILQAQQGMTIGDGTTVNCPAGNKDSHNHNGVSALPANFFDREKTAEFTIIYGPGALANPEAMNAFQFAIDIWSRELVSSVPIRVFLDLDIFPSTGTIASARSTYNVSNFPGAPNPSINYPAALANALAGRVLQPEADSELSIRMNRDFDFYFGTDGNTPEGLTDFVSTALHELGHGLGFLGLSEVSDTIGSFSVVEEIPIVYSNFLVNSENVRALSIPDNSIRLGAFLTSEDVFIDAPSSIDANSGVRPRVFAPSVYASGSSISHWDENTFPEGNPNALMTPVRNRGESMFNIGDITRGLFKDMGWTLNDDALFALSASKASGTLEITQGETATQSVFLKNESNQTVTYNAVLSQNPNNLDITLTNAENVTLAPGEERTVSIAFNTSNATVGLFTAELKISTNISPIEIRRPLQIGILNGSETAILNTIETLEEELVVINEFRNTFRINNSGNRNLNYSIAIEHEASPFLNINDTEGTVFRNAFVDIAYTINANNLPEGQFTSNIVITSNASNTPTLRIPVVLNVRDTFNPPVFNIDLEDPVTVNFDVDTEDILEKTIAFNVNNLGELPLDYNFDFINTNAITVDLRGINAGTVLGGLSDSRTLVISLNEGAIGRNINTVMRFTSNDPDAPEVLIPLNITTSRERGRLSLDTTSAFSATLEAGSSETRTLRYVNDGLAPVVITNVLGSNSTEVLNWRNAENGSSTINVGEVLEVTTRFTPEGNIGSTVTGFITINSNATLPNLFDRNYTFETQIIAPSNLVVSNTKLIRFVNLNSSTERNTPETTQRFEITNTENTPIDFTLALQNTTQSIFSINTFSGTLAPQESTTVAVTFDASQLNLGRFQNAILITINGNETPEATVDLELNIINEQGRFGKVPPIFIDNFFDSFAFGFTEITNTSPFPIEISTITLDINSAFIEIFGFALESGEYIQGEPFTLLPNDTLTIDLSYIATANGPINGNLVITSNAAPNTLKIPLEGVINDELDPEIFAFQIVDVTTNAVLENFAFGETDVTIDLASYPNPVTLTAVTGAAQPGSIVFTNPAGQELQTDNEAPFALSDSSEHTTLNAFNFTLGTQTIIATPFSEANGAGFPFIESEITLTVIDSSLPFVTNFVLVDAETNTAIKTLEEGETIDLSTLNTTGVNIIAETDTPVKSVAFNFNGNARFDIFAPYSVGIDFKGDFRPLTLNSGVNTITATPNTLIRYRGFVNGNPKTINFNVIGELLSRSIPNNINTPIAFTVAPNPVSTEGLFKIDTANTEDLVIRLNSLLNQELGGANRTSIDANGNGRINMSGLQHGLYILSIEDTQTGQAYRARIIKR